jgi:hypothetical protein
MRTYGPRYCMEMRGQLHARVTLFGGIIHRYRSDRKVGGSQEGLVCSREEKYEEGLLSLWLYKEKNLRDWKKCIYSTYSPLSSTHLWLLYSNFFNPSKKNSFGCAANRKSQRLISTPTYNINVFFSKVIICMLNQAPCHGFTRTWRSGGMAPHVIDIRTLWRWMMSFMNRQL